MNDTELSRELNEFVCQYAALVQNVAKTEYNLEMEHRECWEIIISLVGKMFPENQIESESMEQLKEDIITETVNDIRDIILSRSSTIH